MQSGRRDYQMETDEGESDECSFAQGALICRPRDQLEEIEFRSCCSTEGG